MYERYRVFRVNTNPYLCDVVKCLWLEVAALRTFGLIFHYQNVTYYFII